MQKSKKIDDPVDLTNEQLATELLNDANVLEDVGGYSQAMWCVALMREASKRLSGGEE